MAIPPASFKSRASLLDRLIDAAPLQRREPRPLRTMDRPDIRAAIARDLGWLLNTRTPLTAEEFEARELTVIDYGVPDFGKGSPASVRDQKLRANLTEKAIRVFEPRLRDVKVSITTDMDSERSLRMTIEAVMVGDDLAEPVSFETIYDAETDRTKINA